MTIAASFERPRQGNATLKPDSFWRRFVVIISLIGSDLICFFISDMLLRLVLPKGPPGLALFPSSSHSPLPHGIDLVFLIAIVFVVARYLVGEYSRRQLFWDSARATTSALLICTSAYLAVTMLFASNTLLLTAAVWLGLIFLLPTARQGTRYILSRIGFWNLPTAILGTNHLAQESVSHTRAAIGAWPPCPMGSARKSGPASSSRTFGIKRAERPCGGDR